MNNIKGLIIKDLLQLKSYKKTLIMFIIIFAFTAIAQETNGGIVSMLVIMMALGFGMFSIATFSYDEMAKADKYILTLPLTKKEIVLSKYILVICLTTIGAVFGMILSFIITFLVNKEMPDMMELISLGLGGIFGIGIIEAVQIPCIYKFGVEKGRIQIFTVIALIALLIGGVFFIGEKLNFSFFPENIDIFNNFLPIILIALTVVIYYISYKISYKIYVKKEV